MLKFKNAQTLSRTQMKNLTGGNRPPNCPYACTHRIKGQLRFGCPPYEECVTYSCDTIYMGESCQPL